MGYAPVAIAPTMLRKRVGLPPWLSITIASGAPLALAAAHYVVDVLAGLAVAEIVHRAEPLATPLVHMVAYALE